MPDRIDTIRKLLARGEDVFLRYSLAMELASAGRVGEAVAEFGRCMELDPEYLPAYTEAGKALRSAGRLEEARRMFQSGMELAGKLGDSHTRDYLQQQLEGLGGA